jgi:hypothetical protein
MVVYARKPQVLKRQMTQFFNRLIDTGFATLNFT